jgi:hypothetical protein
MQVVLFNDITTEDALASLEAEAEKYTGLHVEMENSEERKFVKGKASLIAGILKKLDRARIDKSKEYKLAVEEEAAKIKSRLLGANKPFQDLIDDYKALRAKQLEEEKALQAAKDLAFQLPLDHEEALTMNKLFDFEKSERIRQAKERDERIAAEARRQAEIEKQEAEERAEQAERDRILAEAKAKRDAEQAAVAAEKAVKQAAIDAAKDEQRKQEALKAKAIEEAEKLEANKKHVAKICGQSKKALIETCGIDEPLAKIIIQAIAKKQIRNITINY